MNIQDEIEKIKKLSKEDREKMKPSVERTLNQIFEDWGDLYPEKERERIKKDLLGKK